jgi:hypothetical protein
VATPEEDLRVLRSIVVDVAVGLIGVRGAVIELVKKESPAWQASPEGTEAWASIHKSLEALDDALKKMKTLRDAD